LTAAIAIIIKLNINENNGINKAEFYIDDELQYTDTTLQMVHEQKKLIGNHELAIIAYDNAGNTVTQSINILKLL